MKNVFTTIFERLSDIIDITQIGGLLDKYTLFLDFRQYCLICYEEGSYQ